MNRIVMLIAVLTASLLISASPAFSGTGPYGGFGPFDSHGVNPSVESQQIVFSGGTGPYGGYGPYSVMEGSESHQFANKDECLLIAKNCPREGFSNQEKIERLNSEISKGKSTYTDEELRELKGKLNDAYKEQIDSEMFGGY